MNDTEKAAIDQDDFLQIALHVRTLFLSGCRKSDRMRGTKN
jgi:hypothetical protein